MHEEQSLTRAASAIARHAPRIPFLKFGEGSGQLALAYRKKGAVIEDPDFDFACETLQTGIYRRFRRVSGDTEGCIWMRISSVEEDEILDALSETFNSMSYVDIESLPMDAGFQVMQYEDAADRSSRRQAGGLHR